MISKPSMQDVFQRLVKENALTETLANILQETAQREAPSDDAPWYILGLRGLGAWASAAFLLLALWLHLPEGPEAQLLVGLFLLMVTGFARRKTKAVFWQQLCLSVALVGAFICGVGLFSFPSKYVWACLLALALWAFFPDAVVRFFAAVGIPVFLEDALGAGAPDFLMTFCLVLGGFLWCGAQGVQKLLGARRGPLTWGLWAYGLYGLLRAAASDVPTPKNWVTVTLGAFFFLFILKLLRAEKVKANSMATGGR